MTDLHDPIVRSVPPRALAISLGALAVPVFAALVLPDELAAFGALLWLLALIPGFLLAYHRGWSGVATSLALGMATLSITQAVVTWLDRDVPDILLGVVVAYIVIALGIGWVTDLLRRERANAETLAFLDPVTRLSNRRHAMMFLATEFAAAQRGRRLAVVLFDIDGFKQYNDRLGHAAGDAALEAFAGVLVRFTRRMNLSARYGGDEFLSVLSGSEGEGAMVFAERVREAFEALELGNPPLTITGGIATYDPGVESDQELLASADQALYEAKRNGRNRNHLFQPPPPTPSRRAVASGAGGNGAPSTPLMGASRLPEDAPGPDRKIGAGRRVLVVEDEAPVRELLKAYLERQGFRVSEAGDVTGAVDEIRHEFDVVVTDIDLPGAPGSELVAAVKARWPATQVIVVTGLDDARVAAAALNAGADRYLFKPFGMPELRAHLADALERRDVMVGELAERRALTHEARERESQARDAVLKGARALVRAVEVRDAYTRGHSLRVARYAEVLARHVDPDGILVPAKSLRLGCELHDVGKIGVPDAILNKEGPLSADEFLMVKSHPTTGRRILEPLLDDDVVLAVVTWHHERWDGAGYPDGLASDAIPLAARIAGVADTIDAMTSNRAYRVARGWGEAMKQIGRERGEQFDPGLVDAALAREAELRRVFDQHTSQETLAY